MRNKHLQSRLSLLLLCLLGLTFVLSACQEKTYEDSRTEELIGTVITVRVFANDKNLPAKALEGAFNHARELENIFSAKINTSELSYVNQQASSQPVEISSPLFDLLEKSVAYARLSEGAFDPTLGNLIELWGIGTDHAKIPAANELQPLINQHNYENIILDREQMTVYLDGDFTLDLGAIAKGYIGDEMKRVLIEEYQIECALLNLGGNILTIGTKTDGSAWRIGIADPDDPASSVASVSSINSTVVTSGNYERYFEEDGLRYHHILDGSSGYPAYNGLISTTIITETSADADALSTTAYVLGLDKAMALIESLDNVDAVFIDDEGKFHMSSGITDEIFSITN